MDSDTDSAQYWGEDDVVWDNIAYVTRWTTMDLVIQTLRMRMTMVTYCLFKKVQLNLSLIQLMRQLGLYMNVGRHKI